MQNILEQVGCFYVYKRKYWEVGLWTLEVYVDLTIYMKHVS